MSNYVLAFRVRPDRPSAPGEEQACGYWFAGLGSAITDCGNRVTATRTLPAGRDPGPASRKPAQLCLMGRSLVGRGDGEGEGGSVGGVQPEVLADRAQCGQAVPSDAEIGRWRSPVAFVADADAYSAQAAVLGDQLELVGDGTGCAIAVAM